MEIEIRASMWHCRRYHRAYMRQIEKNLGFHFLFFPNYWWTVHKVDTFCNDKSVVGTVIHYLTTIVQWPCSSVVRASSSTWSGVRFLAGSSIYTYVCYTWHTYRWWRLTYLDKLLWFGWYCDCTVKFCRNEIVKFRTRGSLYMHCLSPWNSCESWILTLVRSTTSFHTATRARSYNLESAAFSNRRLSGGPLRPLLMHNYRLSMRYR